MSEFPELLQIVPRIAHCRCCQGVLPAIWKAHALSSCCNNNRIQLNCIHDQARKVVAEKVWQRSTS